MHSFGAAFTSFYRLVGPYKSNDVVPVIKTELWETITRRGILGKFIAFAMFVHKLMVSAGNLLMGVIPMVFYLAVNAAAYATEKIWTLCGGPPLFDEAWQKT